MHKKWTGFNFYKKAKSCENLITYKMGCMAAFCRLKIDGWIKLDAKNDLDDAFAMMHLFATMH